jgi:hypothetical protein
MQFGQVPVETLEVREETNIHGVPVQYPDSIVRIERGDETVSGLVNGLEMAGSDVPPHPCDRKVQHQVLQSCRRRPLLCCNHGADRTVTANGCKRDA